MQHTSLRVQPNCLKKSEKNEMGGGGREGEKNNETEKAHRLGCKKVKAVNSRF
jgi:hypothetical protein